MKKLYILFIPLLFAIAASGQPAADDEFRQFVSWGLIAGPNLTGYRMNVAGSEYAPDKTHCGLGLEAGALLEYHITTQWSMTLTATGNIERVRFSVNDSTDVLTTFGTDISASATYRLPLRQGTVLISAGPYTHFVFTSLMTGDGAIPNPYTRVISNDPHTGEASFAMNDFNAGFMFDAGYEFDSRWQVHLNLKWGVSDLLNYDSHELYTKPYKIGVLLSYSFQ